MEKRWKLRNGRSLREEFSVFLTLIIGQGKEPFPFVSIRSNREGRREDSRGFTEEFFHGNSSGRFHWNSIAIPRG